MDEVMAESPSHAGHARNLVDLADASYDGQLSARLSPPEENDGIRDRLLKGSLGR